MKRQKPSLVKLLISQPRILSRACNRAPPPMERNEGARRPLWRLAAEGAPPRCPVRLLIPYGMPVFLLS